MHKKSAGTLVSKVNNFFNIYIFLSSTAFKNLSSDYLLAWLQVATKSISPKLDNPQPEVN